MNPWPKAAETIDQRRFTVEEYHRMAESGIFKPDERVELIRGVVHRMSPKSARRRSYELAPDTDVSELFPPEAPP